MSDKSTILLQLDTDPQPSVFARVVAVDAGGARLLAREGAEVRSGSRQRGRAEAVCEAIREQVPGAAAEAAATATAADGPKALAGRLLVVTAGAAGVVLLPKKVRTACATLQVAIDLNAVPP